MKTYKHSNGRIMARNAKGQFRNFTLSDFGFETNADYLVCGKCGYGEVEKWMPVLKDGECPKCGNTENHRLKEIPLSAKAEELMAKIAKLEERIGIRGPFIHPMLFNQHKGELGVLKRDLELELKSCADKAFIVTRCEKKKVRFKCCKHLSFEPYWNEFELVGYKNYAIYYNMLPKENRATKGMMCAEQGFRHRIDFCINGINACNYYEEVEVEVEVQAEIKHELCVTGRHVICSCKEEDRCLWKKERMEVNDEQTTGI